MKAGNIGLDFFRFILLRKFDKSRPDPLEMPSAPLMLASLLTVLALSNSESLWKPLPLCPLWPFVRPLTTPFGGRCVVIAFGCCRGSASGRCGTRLQQENKAVEAGRQGTISSESSPTAACTAVEQSELEPVLEHGRRQVA